MRSRKTSWNEKLRADKGLPKLEAMPEKWRERYGDGPMLIPSPMEVDHLMRWVPEGKLTTIEHIRLSLAHRHGASVACPMTTGIFAWIAAHAAHESALEGRRDVTPYWRTLKRGGELNPKYPGGIESVMDHLQQEGHHVEQRGKRFWVTTLESNLFDPSTSP